MEHTFSNRNPFAVVFTIINPTLCLLINMGSTTTELQATNMVCWKGTDGPRSILDMKAASWRRGPLCSSSHTSNGRL
jgi:hypothetical protein